MDASVDPTTPIPGSHLLEARKRSAKRWLIPLSLILHAGAIGTYVVAGLWRVERLPAERAPVEVVVGTMLVDPGGGDGQKAGRKPPPVKPPPEKQQVKKLVQPVKAAQVSPEQTPATSEQPATEPGDDIGPGKGLGTDPLKPPGGGEPCPPGAECKDGPGKPPGGGGGGGKTDVFVPPTTLEANRTGGLTQIHPTQVTKSTMLHEGKTRVQASIKFCIDERGVVGRVGLMKSSGYAEYDQKLLAGVRAWSYRPFLVNNTPAPVCTAVNFNYVMK